MKQIKETWWEVFQPDGAGQYKETIAKFTTQEDAVQYMNYLSSKSSWPKTVEKKSFHVILFESYDEALSKDTLKADLKEQIKKLEEQLKALG